MNQHRIVQKTLALAALMMLVLVAGSVTAQDAPGASVETVNQLSVNGMVRVSRVVTDRPVFVVIYNDDGTGSPGSVLGYTTLQPGEYSNVLVAINHREITPNLHAVLHIDDNRAGVFEFGAVEGADAMLTGDVTVQPFTVQSIVAGDQIPRGQVIISSVTVTEPSWVTVHAGDAQTFGDVIGFTQVDAGTTSNVVVEVPTELVTPVLWTMIHVDTGTPGVFESGMVDGADLPLVVDNNAAMLPISAVPVIRVASSQVNLSDSGVVTADSAPIRVNSVLSDGAGFLAVHADAGGGPGTVIGFTPVSDGITANVTVEIDPALVTPGLWLALHSDENQSGAFESGIEGADPVVRAGNQDVTVAMQVAPFMSVSPQLTADNRLIVNNVFMNESGFVVVHAGSPDGPVIAQRGVNPGMNPNLEIGIDPAQMTGPLFAVLHGDSHAIGTFEFGSVADADKPALVNNNQVFAVVEGSGGQDTACAVLASADVNLHAQAAATSEISGSLLQGQTTSVVAQMQDSDGLVWWQTAGGQWLASDAVAEQSACVDVPEVADG